ncbi:MAG: tRNA (adenosine(37)-N6)-dimethylallyltransferase MiaA, partial [Saprospiraceae bacterium]
NEQLASVKHHFIADRSVNEPLTAGEYEKEALAKMASLWEKFPILIAVGGSGLFLKALMEGLDDLPKSDPALHAKWEEVFSKNGLSALQESMLQIDPQYFQQIDQFNPRRLIRALVLAEQSGKSNLELRKGFKRDRPFKMIPILLEMDRNELYYRIDLRVDKMMAEGLLQEASNLLSNRDLSSLQTVGYREIFDHLDGKYDLPAAIDKIKQHTRNYAKRQMTWFNNSGEWHRFHPSQMSEIKELIGKETGYLPEPSL